MENEKLNIKVSFSSDTSNDIDTLIEHVNRYIVDDIIHAWCFGDEEDFRNVLSGMESNGLIVVDIKKEKE